MDDTPFRQHDQRLKLIIRTGSRHKDAIRITEKHGKVRTPKRNSTRFRIALLDFEYPDPKPKAKTQRQGDQQSTDQEQIGVMEQFYDHLTVGQKLMEKSHQTIIEKRNFNQKFRIHKELLNEKFLWQKKWVEKYTILKDMLKLEAKDYEIQLNHVQRATEEKFYIFNGQQTKKKNEINSIKNKVEEKKKQSDQMFNQLLKKTEQLKIQQRYGLDLKKKITSRKQVLQEKTKSCVHEQSQIFVLKIQLNSHYLCSFMANKQGCDLHLALNKEYRCWQKSRQFKMDIQDLKRWILLQLYRGWKTLLKKLSYQSSQYQILFGEVESQIVFQDLRRLMSQQKPRASSRKFQKFITFYSQAKIKTSYKEKLLSLLKNFNNGLIAITQLQFIQENDQTFLEIHYRYLIYDQQLVERFLYQENYTINKDKIAKDIKVLERRLFIFVEIPTVCHIDQYAKYEEVYELLRKKKVVAHNKRARTRSMPKVK